MEVSKSLTVRTPQQLAVRTKIDNLEHSMRKDHVKLLENIYEVDSKLDFVMDVLGSPLVR